MKLIHKQLIAIGVLAVLSPVGLYLPEIFKAGSAWGEWGTEELKNICGYIPAGMERLSHNWNGIMPGYTFHGWNNTGMIHNSLGYIIAALLGISLCLSASFLIGKFLSRKDS
jgi:cobalt/nickel transport protein